MGSSTNSGPTGTGICEVGELGDWVSARKPSAAKSSRAWESVWRLDADSTPEDMERLCGMVHALALTVQARAKYVPFASLYATVLFQPAALAGTFLPQMPKDDLFNAMMLVKWGSGRRCRWLACRRGHPYMLDACGAAASVSKCAECGVLIGGMRHQRIEYVGEWNLGVRDFGGEFCYRDPGPQPPGVVECDRDIDPQLQGCTQYYRISEAQDLASACGYCLPCVSSSSSSSDDVQHAEDVLPPGPTFENMHMSSAEMAAATAAAEDAARLQRFFLHAVMAAGAAFGGTPWLKAALAFWPAGTSPHQIAQTATLRCIQDWRALTRVCASDSVRAEAANKDDGYMAPARAERVHGMLGSLTGACVPPPPLSAICAARTLGTRTDRLAWEAAFRTHVM
jgi:hypothetical protein